ncbi:MAG: hypothetical protein K2G36_06885 [Ruminococcus sp.]|nr:hypothetical protein [Ruminococcus sp.]
MKKFIALLCLTALLTSCGNLSLTSEDSKGGYGNSQNIQDNDSASTPAYIVVPDGEDYVEMKSSIEHGSVLCRLYNNDKVIFNRSVQQWADISTNGFTGYVELSNISFSEVDVKKETTPPAPAENQEQQQQEQTPAETPADNTPPVQVQTPVETPPETTPPPVVVQTPAETPADNTPPVQAMDNIGINIENKIENVINIEFALDDFQVKYATPLSYPKYVEDKTEGYCIVESCYIFSEPSSDSYKDVKYMVYKDSAVEILGSVDDWYFIRRDFGSQSYRIGYVPKSYIALGKSPEIAPSLCSQVIVSKGSACINRYAKICEGDDVLGYAKQGQVYDVYDLIDNYWYKIGYGSGYAYISHKMVDPY